MKIEARIERLREHGRAFWASWRWYILFLFGVWIPVRSVVADYNPVPSGSMNPTLLEGDVVFVNKLAYGLRVPLTHTWITTWDAPARGEIVVVLSPEDGTRLVKRVVGVPGDSVAMTNGRLVINGHPLEYASPREEYGDTIAHKYAPMAVFAEEQLPGAGHAVMGLPALAGAPRNFGPVEVPAGKVFLLGDNRDNSHDSRAFGLADQGDVLGRAVGVIVSLDINDTWWLRTGRFCAGLR